VGQRSRARPKLLPAKLLAIRLKLGISQSQLARLLDFNKGTARISEYEHGIREPDLIVLLNYAKLARISMDVLANDNLELKFPKRWKRPRNARALLMQDRVNETSEQF
jgi:transcriptional regulator with XRE-family HTH domain